MYFRAFLPARPARRLPFTPTPRASSALPRLCRTCRTSYPLFPSAAASKVHVVVDDSALSRWPATGNIRFEDVWMQYRLDAAWALTGVTFRIADGEKVGAVGRTGSGKSTTLLALYRMFELGRGRILIDGVDIATLPLKRLRAGGCTAVVARRPGRRGSSWHHGDSGPEGRRPETSTAAPCAGA
jgi:ABC-type multidrug transport system fused ATPase/permease subunit